MKTTITNSMTKGNLVDFMEEVISSDKYVLKDKSLVDMVTYTLKKYKEKASQVLKADLLDIAQELADYITPQQETLVPVETKIKPVKETKETKEETKEEPTKPTKTTKKTIKPTKTTKKPKREEEAFVLPEKLETDIGDYTLVTEGIDSVKDLSEAIEQGRNLVMAIYWSEQLLKKYQYSGIPKFQDVKSFPNDYDITQPVYFLENLDGFYALSIYTECMGFYTDITFEQVDGVRYSNTAEWGLYELDYPEEEKKKVEETVEELVETEKKNREPEKDIVEEIEEE